MIAVITGDIIASRKIIDQDKWLLPLKNMLATWGNTPKNWKIERGDSFQIEVLDVNDALKRALEIKSLVKKVEPIDERKKISTIDVRLAIGIGDKTYSSENISESNGTAFINSGQKFDLLRKESITLGIKTPWQSFDDEMNLYLKLASVFMDKWTVSSAELMHIIFANADITQEDIGKLLGIKQNSVSGRWNRANVNEILAVEEMYRKKIKNIMK